MGYKEAQEMLDQLGPLDLPLENYDTSGIKAVGPDFDPFLDTDTTSIPSTEDVAGDTATAWNVLKETGKAIGRAPLNVVKGFLSSYDVPENIQVKIGEEVVDQVDLPFGGEKFIGAKEVVDVALGSDFLTANEGVMEDMGFMDQLMFAAPNVGIAAALSIATRKPAIGSRYMGLQIMGSTIESQLKEGVDVNQAVRNGIYNTLIQSKLEQIGLDKTTKLWRGKSAIAKRLKDMALATGTETGTEAFQVLPDRVFDFMAKDVSADELDAIWGTLSDPETYKQMGIEGSMGGIFGFGISGAGALRNMSLKEASSKVKVADLTKDPIEEAVENGEKALVEEQTSAVDFETDLAAAAKLAEEKAIEKAKKRRAKKETKAKPAKVESEFKKTKPVKEEAPKQESVEVKEDEVIAGDIPVEEMEKDIADFDKLIAKQKNPDVIKGLKQTQDIMKAELEKAKVGKETAETTEGEVPGRVDKPVEEGIKEPAPEAEEPTSTVFSKEQIEGALDEADVTTEHPSKETKMSGEDFLRLTTASEERVEGIRKAVDKPDFTPDETKAPILVVNKEGEVVGHDGRHRAMVNARAGKEMDVLVVSEETGQPIDNINELKSQKFGTKTRGETVDIGPKSATETLREQFNIPEAEPEVKAPATPAISKLEQPVARTKDGEIIEGEKHLPIQGKKIVTDEQVASISKSVSKLVKENPNAEIGYINEQGEFVPREQLASFIAGTPKKERKAVSFKEAQEQLEDTKAEAPVEEKKPKEKEPVAPIALNPKQEAEFKRLLPQLKNFVRRKTTGNPGDFDDVVQIVSEKLAEHIASGRKENFSFQFPVLNAINEIQGRGIGSRRQAGKVKTVQLKEEKTGRGVEDVQDFVGLEAEAPVDARLESVAAKKALETSDALQDLVDRGKELGVKITMSDEGNTKNFEEAMDDAKGKKLTALLRLRKQVRDTVIPVGKALDTTKITDPVEREAVLREMIQKMQKEEQISRKAAEERVAAAVAFAIAKRGAKAKHTFVIKEGKIVDLVKRGVVRKEEQQDFTPEKGIAAEKLKPTSRRFKPSKGEERPGVVAPEGAKKMVFPDRGDIENIPSELQNVEKDGVLVNPKDEKIRQSNEAAANAWPPLAQQRPKEKGGMAIKLPGRDKLFRFPRDIAKKWTSFVDGVYGAINRKVMSTARTNSKVDMVLSAIVDKFGLDEDFQAIDKDYGLQIYKANQIAGRLSKAIDGIDEIVTRVKSRDKVDIIKNKMVRDAQGKFKGFEPRPEEEQERMREALDRRKLQIAQGSLVADEAKHAAIFAANREFEKLEQELRISGLLRDHQFRELNRRERAAALASIRKEDELIREIEEGLLSAEDKKKEIRKHEKARKKLIVRLQQHYKNSGTNYIRHINSEIDQRELYRNQLKLDSLSKKFAKRRNNWIVKEEDGRIRVQRKMSNNNLKSTAELVGKGIMQEHHDLHLNELFNNIAKNEEDLGIQKGVEIEGVSPWATDNPNQYPDTVYKQIPADAKQFGILAGMHVEKHIHDSLQQTFKEYSDFSKDIRRIFQTWKAGKTVWSPGTTTRNAISNLALAHILGDVNILRPSVYKEFVQGWKEASQVKAGLIPQGQFARELMEDTQIYKSSFTTAELTQHGDDYITALIEKIADMKPGSGFASLLKGASDAPGVKGQGLARLGPYIYDQLEIAMKSVVYKKARNDGMSIEDAEAKAQRALFDYSSVPPAIRWTRDWYSPFVTFTYKALPAMAKQVGRKPWKILPYYLASKIGQEVSDFMLGEDDEEREAKERLLPEYMQRNTLPGFMPSHMRMPFQTPDGRDKYIDLSFWLPWGGATEMADGAMGWVPSFAAPSNPAFTTMATLVTNNDIFTGQPILLDTDTMGRTIMKLGLKFYNEAAPTVMTEQKINKVLGAVYGDKNVLGQPQYSVADAMLDYATGIKFRNIDYMEQSMWRQVDLQKKAREIQKDISKRLQKKLIRQSHRPWNRDTVDERNALMNEYMDRMDEVKNEYHYRFMKENDSE